MGLQSPLGEQTEWPVAGDELGEQAQDYSGLAVYRVWVLFKVQSETIPARDFKGRE